MKEGRELLCFTTVSTFPLTFLSQELRLLMTPSCKGHWNRSLYSWQPCVQLKIKGFLPMKENRRKYWDVTGCLCHTVSLEYLNIQVCVFMQTENTHPHPYPPLTEETTTQATLGTAFTSKSRVMYSSLYQVWMLFSWPRKL